MVCIPLLSKLVQIEPGEDATDDHFGGIILHFLSTSLSRTVIVGVHYSQIVRQVMVERHYTFLIFGLGIN